MVHIHRDGTCPFSSVVVFVSHNNATTKCCYLITFLFTKLSRAGDIFLRLRRPHCNNHYIFFFVVFLVFCHNFFIFPRETILNGTHASRRCDMDIVLVVGDDLTEFHLIQILRTAEMCSLLFSFQNTATAK